MAFITCSGLVEVDTSKREYSRQEVSNGNHTTTVHGRVQARRGGAGHRAGQCGGRRYTECRDHVHITLALAGRTAASPGGSLSWPGASNPGTRPTAQVAGRQSAAANKARHFKKSHGLLRHPRHLRHACIHTERQTYPMRLLCAVLKVSRSGYYQFVQGGGGRSTAKTKSAFIAQVQLLHQASVNDSAPPDTRTAASFRSRQSVGQYRVSSGSGRPGWCAT